MTITYYTTLTKQIQYILIKIKILQNYTLYVENNFYTLQIERYRVFCKKYRFFYKKKKVSNYKQLNEFYFFQKNLKTQDIEEKI